MFTTADGQNKSVIFKTRDVYLRLSLLLTEQKFYACGNIRLDLNVALCKKVHWCNYTELLFITVMVFDTKSTHCHDTQPDNLSPGQFGPSLLKKNIVLWFPFLTKKSVKNSDLYTQYIYNKGYQTVLTPSLSCTDHIKRLK